MTDKVAGPDGSALSEGLGLRAWLVERYDNAMAIAARKTNADRAGWLEDAAYFKAAVKALDSRTEAVSAERERCAKAVEAVPPHQWVDGSDQWGQPCPVKVVATRADYLAAIRGA